MASSASKILAAGSVLFGGLLAGVTVHRALVQLPAWQRVGVLPWAYFTRAENSGIGAIFYPVLGLAALLLTISTAVAYKFGRAQRFASSVPVYASASVAIVWAVVTRIVLVPALYALNTAEDDVTKLRQIFEAVRLGSAVNDILHVVAFVLSLWALIALCSNSNER